MHSTVVECPERSGAFDTIDRNRKALNKPTSVYEAVTFKFVDLRSIKVGVAKFLVTTKVCSCISVSVLSKEGKVGIMNGCLTANIARPTACKGNDMSVRLVIDFDAAMELGD